MTKWGRTVRLRQIGLLAALAVLTSACGGPRTPVAVGVKEFPTDVILGAQSTPAPARPAIVTVIPAPFELPSVPRPVTSKPAPTLPPPTVEQCPKADPIRTTPKLATGNRATQVPVASTYLFRTQGKTVVGNSESLFPPEIGRKIQNIVKNADGSFDFQVVQEFPAQTSTKSYHVIPKDPLAANAGTDANSGIYLAAESIKTGTAVPVVYDWSPDLLVLPFPAEAGKEWDVSSTALQGQAVIRYHGRIGELVPDIDTPPDGRANLVRHDINVDACGQYIRAFNVQIYGPNPTGQDSNADGIPDQPPATLITPGSNLQYREQLAIAPQYGGIIVMDSRRVEGTEGGKTIRSDRNSIINTVPMEPK